MEQPAYSGPCRSHEPGSDRPRGSSKSAIDMARFSGSPGKPRRIHFRSRIHMHEVLYSEFFGD